MSQSDETAEVEDCLQCGIEMNVSGHEPFARVVCPECGVEGHVKCDIGNYTVSARHGVGGMSVVYAAVDKTLGRTVAIKLLNEEFSKDQKRIEEFEKEAKITASISHPNVVRVFTVGQAYQRYFIAMELVKGQSLEQMMNAQGAVTEKDLVRLAIEVVEGLQAAHNAGLIHRDMKPGNVLIDSKGRAKIVDFGLALVTQGGKAMAEEIWATPYYVPPETLLQKEEDLRSDVYALGCSLYHAVSGVEPFTTKSRSTGKMIALKQEIKKLSAVAKSVSSHFANVIDTMMEFHPADRYQDYDSLLVDLHNVEHFLRTGETAQFGPIETNKFRKLVWLGAGAALLGVGGYFFFKDEPQPYQEVVKAPAVTQEQKEKVEESAEVASLLRGALHSFQKGDLLSSATVYTQIATDVRVEKVTAYWAGLHAAGCHWLDANPHKAQAVLLKTKRIHAINEPADGMERKLVEAIERLTKEEAVKRQGGESTFDSADVVIGFTSALKEWEQGRWALAIEHLDVLQELAKLPDHDAASMYLAKVSSYREDFRVLETVNGSHAETKEEVELQLSNLQRALQKLKTTGKAKEHVTTLLHEAQQKHQQLLAAELAEERRKQETKERWKAKKKAVQVAYDTHRYSEVLELLKNYKAPTQKGQKWCSKKVEVALVIVNLQQATFEAVEDESARYLISQIELGNSAGQLVGATQKGIKVRDSVGSTSVLVWHEMTPQMMLRVHSALKLSKLEEPVRLRRSEQLIIYAWRHGLTDKANEWAQKLIAEVPDFQEKWEKLTL